MVRTANRDSRGSKSEEFRDALFQYSHFVFDAAAFGVGAEALDGFIHWFVRELEGSVVHRDHAVGFEVDEGLDGVFG